MDDEQQESPLHGPHPAADPPPLGPPDPPEPARAKGTSWDRRPALSRALKIAVFAGPIIASLGVAALLNHVLPRSTSVGTSFLWTGVIIASSLATLVALERAARQLLPLAALLNLSLIFPDKAPARFAVARQTGKPSDLQARLQRARETGHEDEARGMQTVIELVLALSVHDKGSRGHSERVRVFTDLLADEMKIPEHSRNKLRWAALLHDIGKLEVPTTILNKPDKPSQEEWTTLHRHPEEGARLVAPLLPWLGVWGLAVAQHHERFDGTGYPHHLRGHEISLAARIVSVADTYEVMTAPRPYKRPMSVSAARQELVRVAGTQLDASIVRAFLNISVGRLWRTIGFGAWISQVPTIARLFSFTGSFGSTVSMGIGTASMASVLAVSGVVGVGPDTSSTGTPAGSNPVAVVAPHQGDSSHLPGSTAGPGRAPTGNAVAPPATAAPTASAPASSAPSATAAATATGGATPPPMQTTPIPGSPSSPAATPRPVATPTPPASTPSTTPQPTTAPTPTPAGTPNQALCPKCTNMSPTCTTFCSSSPNNTCLTYCLSINNKLCTSYCVGTGNNPDCLNHCDGHSPACISVCGSAAVGTIGPAVVRAASWRAVAAAVQVTAATTRAQTTGPLPA
jgi:hypothetical protein